MLKHFIKKAVKKGLKTSGFSKKNAHVFVGSCAKCGLFSIREGMSIVREVYPEARKAGRDVVRATSRSMKKRASRVKSAVREVTPKVAKKAKRAVRKGARKTKNVVTKGVRKAKSVVQRKK